MIYKILDNRTARTILFIGVSLGFTLLHANKFFFWDSISQISIPANWYYDNNFMYFFVPDEFATGHLTFPLVIAFTALVITSLRGSVCGPGMQRLLTGPIIQ
jgi:hypothetical protein